MKYNRLAFAAAVVALLSSATHAGSLSLNAGFALAQNSDGGGSLPGLHAKPLAESSIRSDLGVAADARDPTDGAGTIMQPADIDSAAKPSIALAPDAVAPVGSARGVTGTPSPTLSRRPEAHRWQALVPGAIK